MFKTRLISGICLVIIAVALIVTGGNVLLAALAIISLIGMFELYRVVGIEKSALGAAGFLAAVLYYVMLYFRPETDAVPAVFFIAVLMVLLAVYVLTLSLIHISLKIYTMGMAALNDTDINWREP